MHVNTELIFFRLIKNQINLSFNFEKGMKTNAFVVNLTFALSVVAKKKSMYKWQTYYQVYNKWREKAVNNSRFAFILRFSNSNLD